MLRILFAATKKNMYKNERKKNKENVLKYFQCLWQSSTMEIKEFLKRIVFRGTTSRRIRNVSDL